MVRFPFYGKYIGELTLCVKTIMGDSSPNQLGERVQGFKDSRVRGVKCLFCRVFYCCAVILNK